MIITFLVSINSYSYIVKQLHIHNCTCVIPVMVARVLMKYIDMKKLN